jgi:hypothetical protein
MWNLKNKKDGTPLSSILNWDPLKTFPNFILPCLILIKPQTKIVSFSF